MSGREALGRGSSGESKSALPDFLASGASSMPGLLPGGVSDCSSSDSDDARTAGSDIARAPVSGLASSSDPSATGADEQHPHAAAAGSKADSLPLPMKSDHSDAENADAEGSDDDDVDMPALVSNSSSSSSSSASDNDNDDEDTHARKKGRQKFSNKESKNKPTKQPPIAAAAVRPHAARTTTSAAAKLDSTSKLVADRAALAWATSHEASLVSKLSKLKDRYQKLLASVDHHKYQARKFITDRQRVQAHGLRADRETANVQKKCDVAIADLLPRAHKLHRDFRTFTTKRKVVQWHMKQLGVNDGLLPYVDDSSGDDGGMDNYSAVQCTDQKRSDFEDGGATAKAATMTAEDARRGPFYMLAQQHKGTDKRQFKATLLGFTADGDKSKNGRQVTVGRWDAKKAKYRVKFREPSKRRQTAWVAPARLHSDAIAALRQMKLQQSQLTKQAGQDDNAGQVNPEKCCMLCLSKMHRNPDTHPRKLAKAPFARFSTWSSGGPTTPEDVLKCIGSGGGAFSLFCACRASAGKIDGKFTEEHDRIMEMATAWNAMRSRQRHMYDQVWIFRSVFHARPHTTAFTFLTTAPPLRKHTYASFHSACRMRDKLWRQKRPDPCAGSRGWPVATNFIYPASGRT